jgi:transposase
MLDALIADSATCTSWPALARRNMRAKISVLQGALTGHFTERHAFMLGMMLARIGALTAQINTLTTRIGEAIAPFTAQVAQLDEIPGIGITAAQDLLAEIGTDMTRFPRRAPGLLGQVRAQCPPVRRPQQGGHHRPGQPLARRHPRRGRHRRRTTLPAPSTATSIPGREQITGSHTQRPRSDGWLCG